MPTSSPAPIMDTSWEVERALLVVQYSVYRGSIELSAVPTSRPAPIMDTSWEVERAEHC